MILGNTCPVCESGAIAAPHKICKSCYDKVKAYYVQPRERFEQEQENLRLKWLKNGKILLSDTIEHNITFCMKNEAERWERIVGDGLSAVFVMIEAVDDQDPTPIFHRRRISFMCDLIECLNPALFAPVTKEQMNVYTQKALDYWDGKVSDEERLKIYNKYKILIGKQNSIWDEKSLLLWMMLTQEFFDWMWYQWFESVYDAIPDELPDDVWIDLLKKHFADVIKKWVLTTHHFT